MVFSRSKTTVNEESNFAFAREILGNDIISPMQVISVRPGFVYTARQLGVIARSIPSEEELVWCKDNGCALIHLPPMPMSLLDTLSAAPEHFPYVLNRRNRYGFDKNSVFFCRDETSNGWVAIKKEPVANSMKANWVEQRACLSELEVVPNVAEMSLFIQLYFDVRGVRLIGGSDYVRTSSIKPSSLNDAPDDRIIIGSFDARDGLSVCDYRDNCCHSNLGLAACRRFGTARCEHFERLQKAYFQVRVYGFMSLSADDRRWVMEMRQHINGADDGSDSGCAECYEVHERHAAWVEKQRRASGFDLCGNRISSE